MKLDASGAIAIVHANGELAYLQRMNDVSPRGATSSQGKARAAALFCLPTRQVREAALIRLSRLTAEVAHCGLTS